MKKMDFNLNTKHGLNKLNLMIRFFQILNAKESKIEKELNRLKSWLVQQLKRGLKPHEELGILEGILKYIQSEPETNERMKAMNYLFEAEFLTENVTEA